MADVLAIIVIDNVVADDVVVAGHPYAITTIGVNKVATNGGTGGHCHAVAVIQVNPVPHRLRSGAADSQGAVGAVFVDQIVVSADGGESIETDIVSVGVMWSGWTAIFLR